jgi:hypothetical protein
MAPTRKKKLPHYRKELELDSIDYSILSDNFYNVDKKSLLNNKPLEKRLTSGQIDYSRLETYEKFLEKAVKQIMKTAYSVSQFITGEKNVVFKFDSDTSGGSCGLATNIIKIGLADLMLPYNSDMPKQLVVDTIISTVFHELYHKKYTNTDIAKELKVQMNNYYINVDVIGFVQKMFGVPELVIAKISNILEDKRIEEKGAKTYPGYSLFFNEARKYFYSFVYSQTKDVKIIPEIAYEIIAIKLLYPEYYAKYISRVHDKLNSTKEPFGPEIKIFAVRFEKYCIDKKDRIDVDNYIELIKTAHEIFELLPRKLSIALASKKDSGVLTSTLPYPISSDIKSKNPIADKTKLENVIQQVDKLLKEEQLLEDNENKVEKINFEDKDGFSFTEYDFTPPDKFPKPDLKILRVAKLFAGKLKTNLGYLNTRFNRMNSSFELQEGDLDEDDLNQHSHNKNIFYNEEEQDQFSLDLGVLMDESGSMSLIVEEMKKAVLGVALAFNNQPHIKLFIYGHSSYEEKVNMYEYINSEKNILNVNSIYSAKSRLSNADGFAIKKMGQIMNKTKSNNKVLIVLSDGQPNAHSYSGTSAILHTKKSVKELEKKGFFVVQVCMANIENSSAMFSNFIKYEPNVSFIAKLNSLLKNKLVSISSQI